MQTDTIPPLAAILDTLPDLANLPDFDSQQVASLHLIKEVKLKLEATIINTQLEEKYLHQLRRLAQPLASQMKLIRPIFAIPLANTVSKRMQVFLKATSLSVTLITSLLSWLLFRGHFLCIIQHPQRFWSTRKLKYKNLFVVDNDDFQKIQTDPTYKPCLAKDAIVLSADQLQIILGAAHTEAIIPLAPQKNEETIPLV